MKNLIGLVSTEPMLKDNQVFFKQVRVIFIYCLETYKYWSSHKILIIYQHICMAKHILTVGSSFNPQYVPSYTWSDNSVTSPTLY